MQDELGLYYYPNPSNIKVRVYVRLGEFEEIEFRLWEMEHAEVWEKHQWIPMSVIQDAAKMYKDLGKGSPESNPLVLYDLAVAKALIDGK